MELRQLRYFVALAETGNFHRAAERLHISQPPLTVAIRKLEAELGALLFDRGARGVQLTAAGASALEDARAALSQAERFREAVREGSDGRRGRLRVGFVGSATFDLLPMAIPRFRSRYPLVELVLSEGTSIDIARALQTGDMDVGLVRLPLLEIISRVETRSVDRDELHVAVPSGSAYARGESIALEALANEPFVLQSRVSVFHALTLMACHDASFAPRVAQEVEQLSTLLSLVRGGLGVALVPARAADSLPSGVRLLRLVRPVPIETGIALPMDGASIAARNFAALFDTHLVSKAP